MLTLKRVILEEETQGVLKLRMHKKRKKMKIDVENHADLHGTKLVAGMALSPGKYSHLEDSQYLMSTPLAMIVCASCLHMAYTPVDYEEYPILVYGGLISRHCHQCGETTSWLHIEWHRPNMDEPLLFQTTLPDRL